MTLTIPQLLTQAAELRRLRQFDQAQALYREILQREPNETSAMHEWAMIAFQLSQLPLAAELLTRACATNPNVAEYQSNLGLVLSTVGRPDQAIAACQAALRLRPGWHAGLNNLGMALLSKGRTDDAIDAFRQALAGRQDMLQIQLNLANALYQAHRLDEALESLQWTVHQHAQSPEARNALGNVLRELGRIDEAIAMFRMALSLRPQYAKAATNLAMLVLLRGDYAQGWPLYERRFAARGDPAHPRGFTQPQWTGDDLAGKRILIHAERGFGDTIQMARYVPLVAARGGRVHLECHPELGRLLQTVGGFETMSMFGQPLPPFDIHCPMLSLPGALGTTLDTIPADVPYLHADADLAANWRQRLAALPGLKIGVAWAGNPNNRADRARSIPLNQLAPTARAAIEKRATLISLQKGPGAEQIHSAGTEIPLVDWTGELTDFADTAALIDGLDLVITVETAVAHLAGAMGKKVWLLVCHACDWRWMLDREDSPWYPTMRLFRQPALGDWQSPINRLAVELGNIGRP